MLRDFYNTHAQLNPFLSLSLCVLIRMINIPFLHSEEKKNTITRVKAKALMN